MDRGDLRNGREGRGLRDRAAGGAGAPRARRVRVRRVPTKARSRDRPAHRRPSRSESRRQGRPGSRRPSRSGGRPSARWGSRGAGGRASRGGGRTGGVEEACRVQPSGRAASYAGWCCGRAASRKRGLVGVSAGARLFARSGGNRCARHGLSVAAGKTCLVGGGDTQERASHVRHRRTGDRGNCLACGNIVSHHRVGADVGVRGQEAIDGVGSWNERSPLAGLSCGRTGRGSSPHCLTALRSD